MPRRARTTLEHGPYAPPACQVGDVIRCAIRGPVRVVGFSDGPIPWPMTRVADGRGKAFLVVCGGLLKAMGCEGLQAIATAWGVDRSVVCQWRRALREPAIRRRLRQTYRSNFRTERIIAGAKARARPRAPRVRKPRPPRVNPFWTADRDALLGTMPDRQLAEQLGVTRQTIGSRRKALGRAPHTPSPTAAVWAWAAAQDRLLGTMPDRQLAARLGCGLMVVFWRRRKLGVPAFRRYSRKGKGRE